MTTRGSDPRFPGVEPRTDFKEQIEAGNAGVPTGAPPTAGFVVPKAGPSSSAGPVTPATPPSFSSDPEYKDQFRSVRERAKDAYGFGTVSDVDGRVRWAAEQFRTTQGRWPTNDELWAYSPLHEALNHLASGASQMGTMVGISELGQPTSWWTNTMTGFEPIGNIDVAIENMGAISDPDYITSKVYTPEQFEAIAQSLSPVSASGRGSSGRGSSGGVGRQGLVFDRKQLAEEVTNRWRGLLLEEPDDATLSKIVNGYINDANSFWMNEAGQLDFDTYVVDRIRGEDRYNFLYEKKPEFQSESEYMTGFRQTASQFGMNDRATLREVEAGAHSGAGLQGFGERVSRTAEVRAGSTGSYSQRFASTMAQSGLGRT